MALLVDGIILDELTSDPTSPVDGEIWFNTTENRLKVRRNGATEVLIDKDEFEAHSTATTNPHTTTLEQARTAGDTFSGDVNMGGNKILNAGTAGSPTDTDLANVGWIKSHVDSKIRGLDWQESVLDQFDPTSGTPGSPVTGDRYISTATANGWTDKYIYEWDGSAWVETIPNEGYATRVEDENLLYIFDGTNWGSLGGAISHADLLNLTADDHTQYLLVNGTRAMTGNLNMGTNAITNVGNVDGVDVSAHNARHIRAGADEIDGDKLDIDWNPTNYTPTTAPTEVTDADELTAHLAGIDAELASLGGSQLEHKAGKALAAAFSGNPKKATVTFSTAFADANYSPALIAETTGNKTFTPAVDSAPAAGSFVINLGSNSTTGLVAVLWTATKHGEE
jgi:hypothetical protein